MNPAYTMLSAFAEKHPIGVQAPCHGCCRLSTFQSPYPWVLLGASYEPCMQLCRRAAQSGTGIFTASNLTHPRIQKYAFWRMDSPYIRKFVRGRLMSRPHSHREHPTPGISAPGTKPCLRVRSADFTGLLTALSCKRAANRRLVWAFRRVAASFRPSGYQFSKDKASLCPSFSDGNVSH